MRGFDIPRLPALTLPALALLALGACMPAARPTSSQPRPVPHADSAALAALVVPSPVLRDEPVDADEHQVELASGPAASVADAASDATESDLSVDAYASRERVEYYVTRFSGPSRRYVEQGLERGSRYEPMIRRLFREGGLPEDMYYLALVESGYNTNAYSRAAAVGMWQFMTTTAKGMGLRVDWWVDERRDPVRSTHAAVRFLRGLNTQFGSVYLAAAAYNGGPARVARGLTKYEEELDGTESDDAFFLLADKNHLLRETREYVPQLIAATIVARDPARYGLTIRTLDSLAYDSVFAPAGLPLAAAAQAAGTSVESLRELNPQILRGMTPPSGRTLLRLPPGSAAGFVAALDAMPADEKTAVRKLTTKKGDTWSKLAAKAGISASALRSFNPKARVGTSGRLIPHQRLLVPTRAVAAAALSVPDPSIERYGSSSATVEHVVKRGETLSHIALRYRTTTKAIMRLNGMRKTTIRPGQTVKVRRGTRPTGD